MKNGIAICLALVALMFTAQESKAHDGPVARVVTAPVRVAAAVVQARPRLLCPRTVTVSVPVVKTDCCGQVTATGCATACVTARFFPRLKARRLALGGSVTSLGSARSVAWVE